MVAIETGEKITGEKITGEKITGEKIKIWLRTEISRADSLSPLRFRHRGLVAARPFSPPRVGAEGKPAPQTPVALTDPSGGKP
jgi:hypothetical protein